VNGSSDPKQRAIEQWTERPAGGGDASGEPGSRAYFEDLRRGSRAFAPWLSSVLGVDDSRELDILDVGCGPGVQVAEFASAGARVTGLDLVAEHVRQAKQHIAAMDLMAEVVVGDAEQLPFAADAFDRVVSANALQFTPDVRRALSEIHRVLRPGGDARVVLYHRDSAYFWLHVALGAGVLRGGRRRHGSLHAVLARELPWSRADAPVLTQTFSRRRLRKAMGEAGFRDVRISVHGFAPDHAPLYPALARRVPALGGDAVTDRLGQLIGWYIAARGRKPPG
jgi:SAM-dependent methyltransferase